MATVLDLLGQSVALADDFFDGQAADDRAQVPGEDAPDEFFHAVLFGEEASRRVRDGRRVVADFERSDRLMRNRMPCVVTHSSAISASCSDNERMRAFCLIGMTNVP